MGRHGWSGVQGRGEADVSLGCQAPLQAGGWDESRDTVEEPNVGVSVRHWQALGLQRVRKPLLFLSNRTTVQWRRPKRPQQVAEGGDSCQAGRDSSLGVEEDLESRKSSVFRILLWKSRSSLPHPHHPSLPACWLPSTQSPGYRYLAPSRPNSHTCPPPRSPPLSLRVSAGCS